MLIVYALQKFLEKFVSNIFFPPQVHCLRSVDNLFVVVQEFKDYQFKETKVSYPKRSSWFSAVFPKRLFPLFTFCVSFSITAAFII